MKKGEKMSDEQKNKISLDNTGKKRTEEQKINISNAHKGKKSSFGMLGKKHSQEWKDANSLRNKGRKLTDEWKDKIATSNKGKKMSEDSRKKMSEFRFGKSPWNKGKKTGPLKIETRLKMSIARKGEKSPCWKGGVAKENEKERKGIEYKLWREAVFARDAWTCQECGLRGAYLHAHHIKPFSKFKEMRTSIENGVTLCVKCHKAKHAKKLNKII